jgi:hypothetical protein
VILLRAVPGQLRLKPCVPWLRHLSEQYFTFAQSRSHFLRQEKGRWQAAQIF